MRSGWKVSKLVQTGEGLVASAATSLTNPKVLAHLDLVKTGLVDSVSCWPTLRRASMPAT